ncbi:stage II sporulation protein D [Clostridium sp. YIM B02506]|uniref:stage II sporulation protein D n=1 Tax=Clostridium sp. YIM B02506 TaxID=2910680 RepID=UPI001EEE974A|nr:stage II sporulation protein D [Clostridium sp. YIM B02506]
MKRYNFDAGIMRKVALYFSSILCLILIPIIVLNGEIATPKNKDDTTIKEDENRNINNNINNKDFSKIKVHHVESNSNEEMDLEEYIVGVIAAEMPAEFEIEALKAQAIAARTYALKRIVTPCEQANGADICDTVHCQVYISKEKRMGMWDKSQEEEENYWKKFQQAVQETKGKVLSYEGKLVLYPQFFSTSWGKTEDSASVFASDVPYLKSVDSPGEEDSKSYKSNKELTVEEFVKLVNNKYKEAKLSASNLNGSVSILSKNPGGSVAEVKLGGAKIKGTEFRTLLNLKSANFTIKVANGKVNIECIGYGHGVGMSQRGANVMAKAGTKSEEILKHYYQGVEIKDIKEINLN